MRRTRKLTESGPDRSKILVMTDGMLRNYLKKQPNLPGVACVIFDEVHERGVNSDLAIGQIMQVRFMMPNGADDSGHEEARGPPDHPDDRNGRVRQVRLPSRQV